MLPIVARTAQEVLALVPRTLNEAAHALGIAQLADDGADHDPDGRRAASSPAPCWRIARVAGETAPLSALTRSSARAC